MNTLPEAFSFNNRPVRVVVIDGDPWWVASDVAKILGYSETAAMTRRLDDADVSNLRDLQVGGRAPTIISEMGLYEAILGSHVPGVRDFKRWITHEVLPQIRKTGGYGNQVPRAELTRKEILALALEAEEARERAELEAAELRAEAEASAPKAAAFDEFMSADGLIGYRDTARILRTRGIVVTRDQLAELLRMWGMRSKNGDAALEPHVRNGLMRNITVVLPSGAIKQVGKFTPEGIEYPTERLRGVRDDRARLANLAPWNLRNGA